MVPSEEKKKIVLRVFAGQVAEEVQHLLLLLIDKRRTMIFPALCRAFPKLLRRKRNEAEVRVHTAVPLTAAQETRMTEELGVSLGRPVFLNARVRPALLGGVSVEVEGRRWDGSVLARLERLGRELRHRCAMTGLSSKEE